MSDNYNDHGAEAAELRAALERVTTDKCERDQVDADLCAEIARLRADVERLARERDELTWLNQNLRSAASELIADDEKARVEIACLRADCEMLRRWRDDCNAATQAEKREVTRLRELLTRILKAEYDNDRDAMLRAMSDAEHAVLPPCPVCGCHGLHGCMGPRKKEEP